MKHSGLFGICGPLFCLRCRLTQRVNVKSVGIKRVKGSFYYVPSNTISRKGLFVGRYWHVAAWIAQSGLLLNLRLFAVLPGRKQYFSLKCSPRSPFPLKLEGRSQYPLNPLTIDEGNLSSVRLWIFSIWQYWLFVMLEFVFMGSCRLKYMLFG